MTGDVLPQLVCASANPDKVAEIKDGTGRVALHPVEILRAAVRPR